MDVYRVDYEGSALHLLHKHLMQSDRPPGSPVRPRCSDAMWALDIHYSEQGLATGGCRRRLAYAYSGLPREAPSPESALRMAVGTAIHKTFQEVWAPGAGIQLRGCEEEWEKTFAVADTEITLRGHPDGTDIRPCPEGRESNIVELKTGGDGFFSEMWAYGHVPLLAKAEANLHAWALGKDHLCFLHLRVGLEGAGGGAQLWAEYDEGMRNETIQGFLSAAQVALRKEANLFPRGYAPLKARKSREHGSVFPMPWQCNGCPFLLACRGNQKLIEFQDRGLNKTAVLDPEADIPEVCNA